MRGVIRDDEDRVIRFGADGDINRASVGCINSSNEGERNIPPMVLFNSSINDRFEESKIATRCTDDRTSFQSDMGAVVMGANQTGAVSHRFRANYCKSKG